MQQKKLRLNRQISHAVLLASLTAVIIGSSSYMSPIGASVTTAKAPPTSDIGKAPLTKAPLSADQKIIHVLNRLGFGPRPGDVGRVRSLGPERWIEEQLHPEGIDDTAVETKLALFGTLQLPAEQLAQAYAMDLALQRQQALERRQRQAEMNGPLTEGAPGNPPQDGAGQMNRPLRSTAGTNDVGAAAVPPQGQRALRAEQQRLLELAQEKGFQRGTSTQIVGELVDARLLRAIESRKQLQEVLVDFWSNHFNLDVKKGPVRTFKAIDEREVIRPHLWGKFRDLLGASAKSPAMLFYLDNARSTRTVEMSEARRAQRPGLTNRRRRLNTRPGATVPVAGQASPGAMMSEEDAPAEANPAPRRAGGVNENYARELMELHTLGVNGGYTQKDVQEVARCLTGWGIDRRNGTFRFNRFLHDDGEKVVLDHVIPAGGGIRDGEMVLDILAAHPSTARFLARKLCTRLVADEPPDALVERAAQAFLKSDGDLRVLTETVIKSPEFFSPQTYRAKIKSPFEFAVSAVRALGGTFTVADSSRPLGRLLLIADGAASVNPNGGGGRNGARRAGKTLAREIAAMGQPLYSFQAPTGYPEKSQSWVSAGALVARLNFALSLTGSGLADVKASTTRLVADMSGDDHHATLVRLLDVLVGGDVSASTRETLEKQMAPNTPVDTAKMSALILGSPEFQRH